jgi:hypothetical protein
MANSVNCYCFHMVTSSGGKACRVGVSVLLSCAASTASSNCCPNLAPTLLRLPPCSRGTRSVAAHDSVAY